MMCDKYSDIGKIHFFYKLEMKMKYTHNNNQITPYNEIICANKLLFN